MELSTEQDIFGGFNKFNDPFLLNSNLYIPKDFYTALEFSMYLAIKNPLYRQVAQRTAAYFVTDFEFTDNTGDQRERNEIRDYLINTVGFLDALLQAGVERFVYGNSFMYVYYPFRRYLVDRRNDGYREIAISAFGRDVQFDLATMTYSVPDPLTQHLPEKQRKRVNLEFIDRKSQDISKIRIRFLDPKHMFVNMNLISGTCEYVYRFEEFFTAAVKKGEPIHQINETPREMLKAIRDGQDFAFNPGTIYHFKEPFISGISYNGWGIPPIILNYNTIHQVQVMRCINEAIGLDYMLPLRLLSPTPVTSQNGQDAAAATNLGQWQAAMGQVIANKRKDPTALHAVPFPVTYQELGANGKQLAPVELMQFHNDEVLDGFGFASELWHMSLQTQQVPTAIRLFERNFIHVYRDNNSATRWFVKNLLDYMEREQMGVKLQLPSVADNLDNKSVWLQLAAGDEVSRAKAWQAFNIDNPLDEARRRAQEDIEIQKVKQQEQEKFEREMTIGSVNQVVDAMVQGQQQGGGGGAPAGGGAPPAGGGGVPAPPQGGVTPLDIEQQAQEQAQQLLQMEIGARRKLMNQIKATNPVLYAVVQRKMEDMRQEGASQGRKQVSQGG